ncbi:hypothetical protein AQUCO_00400283v1 [Aquilegia coerulea]|uniref:Uncharacterized protein n=1 Tax=Aquilegia coerulea TaxID=218851 RepID=A0A2G5EU43_AQUCA|nr:hypothetical protein AQUCO_00400283v1 [Aquilegia coerulea]
MNTTISNPDKPSQPHLLPRVSSCPRHPDHQFTGFCPSCLRERLAGLDPATNSTIVSSSSSSLLKNSSTTTSSLKSIFRSNGGDKNKGIASSSSSSSMYLPELRRCKSFSGGRGESNFISSNVLEPKRKSCDVRVRNTLWSLFNLDDEKKGTNFNEVWGEIEIETRDLGFGEPVIELKEEEEEEEEEEERGNGGEIRVSDNNIVEDRIGEIEEELVVDGEEIKTMKDHIDMEAQIKKPPSGRDLREIAGSFWLAASIFSKKLQKWRTKQKLKKHAGGGGESSRMPKKKKGMGRQFRETQSEVADYGFGRRSCDTDPRFSLDAGRMSFDDPRHSWDEPRASWDGYLIGKMFPRVPPMVSVVEDDPVPVHRFDNQIPVEELMHSIIEDETAPGGSAQTRDYYSDSSSSQRRRRSLDRSSSIGKTAASMVLDADEMKSASNAKVTPATSDYFHGAKVLITDCNLRDSKSNSLEDDRSESFESASRDAASVAGCNREEPKKSRRWSKGWNIWGFIYRRSGGRKNKCC